MLSQKLIVPVLLFFSVSSFAQKEKISMTEHLQNYSGNGTTIKIHQDARLDSIMSRELSVHFGDSPTGKRVVTTKGFRIQIFSGNDQRISKAEAYEKEKELKAILPNIDSYINFTSPFWRLRVGNYRTSEEAHSMLRELKRLFPRWKEMYIVNETIEFHVPTHINH